MALHQEPFETYTRDGLPKDRNLLRHQIGKLEEDFAKGDVPIAGLGTLEIGRLALALTDVEPPPFLYDNLARLDIDDLVALYEAKSVRNIEKMFPEIERAKSIFAIIKSVRAYAKEMSRYAPPGS